MGRVGYRIGKTSPIKFESCTRVGMINPIRFGLGQVGVRESANLKWVRFGVDRAMLVLVFWHNSLLKLMFPTPSFLNFINKYSTKGHTSFCMQAF